MTQKVKFIIREHHIGRSSRYQFLFNTKFDTKLPINSGDVEVVMSLEDFSRFLIERDKEGIPNSFKELSVEYFEEPKKPVRIFV